MALIDPEKFPNVFYGDVNADDIDWRKAAKSETDDDDDENLPTAQSVIDMLGFDPEEECVPTQNRGQRDVP